jgi:hypothetical protein
MEKNGRGELGGGGRPRLQPDCDECCARRCHQPAAHVKEAEGSLLSSQRHVPSA